MSMIGIILLVVAGVLAIVSFFVPPRAVQLLAVGVICIVVALLLPEAA